MTARTTVDFDTARRLAAALEGVEQGTSWGSPALKVHGRMFACVPNHRTAEPGSLALRLDFADRDELLAADPATYYLPEHYVNYPCVLVRLARITPEALADLLRMAWTFERRVEARRRRPAARRGRPARSQRRR